VEKSFVSQVLLVLLLSLSPCLLFGSLQEDVITVKALPGSQLLHGLVSSSSFRKLARPTGNSEQQEAS